MLNSYDERTRTKPNYLENYILVRCFKILNSKKLAVLTFLGTLAFVSNGLLPSPIDKMLIGIQALCFSLASLLSVSGGATFAALIAGLLLSVVRTGFFPFSLLFSLFYGLMIDGLFYFFKAKRAEKNVESKRLILLLTVATTITGMASMYITTIMGLLPMIPAMYFAIIVVAIFNGVVAGYLTVAIWKRHLSRLL